MSKRMRRRISVIGTPPDTRCKDFIQSIRHQILGRKRNRATPELQQSQVLASRFRQRCHKRKANKFVVQHIKPKSRNQETMFVSSRSLAEKQYAHFHAKTWFQREVIGLNLKVINAKMCNDYLERISDAQQKIEVLE